MSNKGTVGVTSERDRQAGPDAALSSIFRMRERGKK